MYSSILISLLAIAAPAVADSVSVTPHDSYSSSVGVLGCKINTNRVAYWPGSVDCNKICIKLSYEDRSVHLLRIDQSGGAHDISYDAWNYLQTGQSATSDPITGGGVDMEYEEVDASECASLINTDGNKLPLSASNSINYVASCISDSSSWVGSNYVLYNIVDSICAWGYDETCTLNLDESNQPTCPHTLGLVTPLTGDSVYNIEYGTGAVVDASTGQVSSKTRRSANSTSSGNSPYRSFPHGNSPYSNSSYGNSPYSNSSYGNSSCGNSSYSYSRAVSGAVVGAQMPAGLALVSGAVAAAVLALI
ncbi:Cerato-platanin [Pleurostoma richardsiae]|uniref:Cerato-platanin n=1 Tax=Pleurostoma richardsiae TaxID=41990 RepID=A0AA38VXG7_9PEZI|nr:Cerato-platanin [Pleurostoma richardsiae]